MPGKLYQSLLVIAWLFMGAIAIYDVRWAVKHSRTADVWESNPVMRWVIKEYGITAAGTARLCTVFFAACLMPIAPRRCQVTATVTLFSAHLYLAFAYAMILWNPYTLTG